MGGRTVTFHLQGRLDPNAHSLHMFYNSINMSAHLTRNPGSSLDLEWIGRTRVNLPAVKRRADTLKTRRSIKKQWQAAWLLRAVTCIDLTTLSGDDTATNVARLCFKAQNPVRQDLLESMGMADTGITTGAVCVYSSRVPDAVKTLKDVHSKVPVASVAAGFPAGRNDFALFIVTLTFSLHCNF